MTRAVIYARYSSDGQSEASIEDQVRNCRRLCEQRGWEVAEEYADRALTGATSLLRPSREAAISKPIARAHKKVAAPFHLRGAFQPQSTVSAGKQDYGCHPPLRRG